MLQVTSPSTIFFNLNFGIAKATFLNFMQRLLLRKLRIMADALGTRMTTLVHAAISVLAYL